MANTISYRQDEKKRISLQGTAIYAWLVCIITIIVPFAVAYLPLPDFAIFNMARAICLVIFRSMQAMRVYCIAGFGLHVGQGVYAWHLARKVDPDNASGWFWQTFAVGFFSTRLLLEKANVLNLDGNKRH